MEEDKKMKYTERQLYEFVWRADTDEKIKAAEKWLDKNVYPVNAQLWDDLRIALSRQYRAMHGQTLKDGTYVWF